MGTGNNSLSMNWPIQYLLLVEQELGKRKMKVSINNGLRM